jgi:hypothetical protein
MSRVELNILVEGRAFDSPVYDELCRRVLTPLGRTWRIIRADEVTGSGGGGKAALVSFFKYLRGARALHQASHHAVLFCLDKDVEDLFRSRLRSLHVVYTATYDVEGLLIREADLCRCTAYALMRPRDATAFLGGPGAWCHRVAGLWCEWIALCLVILELRVPRGNYSRLSQVNVPVHTAADPALVRSMIADIAGAGGHAVATVDAAYQRRLAQVRRLHRRGEVDRVFKGKWYFDVLRAEVQAALSDTPSRRALEATVMAATDYDASWSRDCRDRIAAIAGLI